MIHWSSFIKTISALVSKILPTNDFKLLHRHGLCSNLKSLVCKIFETNAKMVLINDDQCDIADIVLDVWLLKKKLNHPSL